MNYPHRYGINSLLLNNRGEKFLDAEFLLGIEPRRGGRTHTPWFESTACRKAWAPISAGDSRGKITVMAPLGSRSSVIFDLDGDGDLDIVTNDFNSAPQVLVSDLAQRRPIHWLAGGADRHGVEPRRAWRDRARARRRTRLHAVATTASRATSRRARCRCTSGWATPRQIDRVEVDWPSGRKQVVTQQLEMNRTLRIAEPQL